jgi:AraC-like DNA-binding protein
MFLMGPFLLLYVKASLNVESHTKRTDIIHFIPAILSLIGTLPYYLQPFENKIEIANELIQSVNSYRNVNVNLFYDIGQSFVLRTLSCILYALYSMLLVFRKQLLLNQRKEPMNQQEILIIRWLWILLISMLAISTIFLFFAFQAVLYPLNDVIDNGYNYYVLSSVIYLIMTLSLFQFPTILYGLVRPESIRSETEKKNKNVLVSTIKKIADPKIKVNFYRDGSIKERIALYLKTEKPYTNNQFSLSSIAIVLELSEAEINRCIKKEMHTTFVKLRTDTRVMHAIQLLNNKSASRLTIEAIGEQSGFKTRSNFYSAFKEHTGQTPTEYMAKNNIQI